LSDNDEVGSLSPEDAEAHLREAVTRIRQGQNQRLGAQLAAPRPALDR
jgi:hypothetical protein